MAFKFKYEGIPLRPYSIAELARLYGVDWRTMKAWLTKFEDKLGKKIGRYYNVRQVKIIFQHLDIPGEIRYEEIHKPQDE